MNNSDHQQMFASFNLTPPPSPSQSQPKEEETKEQQLQQQETKKTEKTLSIGQTVAEALAKEALKNKLTLVEEEETSYSIFFFFSM